MKKLLSIIGLLFTSIWGYAQSANVNGAPTLNNFNYNNQNAAVLQGTGVEADVNAQVTFASANIPVNKLLVKFEFSNYAYWDVLHANNISNIIAPANWEVSTVYIDVNTRVVEFRNSVALNNFSGSVNFVVRGIALAANPNFSGNVARLEENPFVGGSLNFTISNTAVANTLSIGTEPLPIDFGKFTVQKVNESTGHLQWNTFKEEAVTEFLVQRSTRGSGWTTIATVPTVSLGTIIHTESNYEYFDNSPEAGVNLYRIKTIDFDQKVNYSVVRNLEFSSTSTPLTLYPNPAKHEVHVNVPNGSDVNVFNVQGQKMPVSLEQFKETLKINIGNLPNGVYIVSVQTNESLQHVQFTKAD